MNTPAIPKFCPACGSPLCPASHEWPSELLVWLFWSDEIDVHDPSGRISEMIHAEMNARGEGKKVAV